MRDSLTEAQAKVKEAIAEIERERAQLQTALSGLNGASSSSAKPTPSKPRKRSKGRRRARKGKRAARGQRQEQFLAAIAEKPGATVTEIARKMGVERTSLYPVAKKLQSENKIAKKGSGYSVRS